MRWSLQSAHLAHPAGAELVPEAITLAELRRFVPGILERARREDRHVGGRAGEWIRGAQVDRRGERGGLIVGRRGDLLGSVGAFGNFFHERGEPA